MGTELSDLLNATATDLAGYWPDYNFRKYDGKLVSEDEAEHVRIDLSVISGVATDPTRGLEQLDLELTMQADIIWRFVDAATHQVNHPLNIAATLLAWAKNRYIPGASSVCTPLGFTQVLDSRDDGEPNMTVQRYVVQWTVEISVTPELDSEGPALIQLGGPAITPPLRELWVNNIQRV